MGEYLEKAYDDLLYGHFNIGYIEYLNTREEFDYFKTLLLCMEDNVAKKINVTIVSHLIKNNDVQDLRQKFNHIFLFGSLKEERFQYHFGIIQLGIVPSLYKNNISQSAIEFVARKIPILCGDKGGESELCQSNLFKFNTEDTNDFIDKFSNLINNQDLLNEYWNNQGDIAKEFIEQERMEVNI